MTKKRFKYEINKKKLPSNKKFGFFFTFIFFVAACYFFLTNRVLISYAFLVFSVFLLLITFINENVLLPLNKAWMKFGLMLGAIIGPIVLGIIFFLLITPYGLIMRFFGRDELRLKLSKRKSHWKLRKLFMPQTNFKKQF